MSHPDADERDPPSLQAAATINMATTVPMNRGPAIRPLSKPTPAAYGFVRNTGGRGNMHRRSWLAGAIVVIVALSLAACATASKEEEAPPEPAKIEKIAGTDVNRLELTQHAVQRLGITTAPVRESDPPVPGRTAVDDSALIYDADGAASVYTNPQPLVYVRAPVTVESIDHGQALLTQGPPPGTAVVTVGAPELYGIDGGIGGNE
jgi:hypothetical protein